MKKSDFIIALLCVIIGLLIGFNLNNKNDRYQIVKNSDNELILLDKKTGTTWVRDDYYGWNQLVNYELDCKKYDFIYKKINASDLNVLARNNIDINSVIFTAKQYKKVNVSNDEILQKLEKRIQYLQKTEPQKEQ